MGVNSLPKTVTRQRRDCDLNPGPSAPESSTLTTRLPSSPASADQYLLLAGRSAANPPAADAAVDRRDRRTDGRTDGRQTVTETPLHILCGQRQ